MQLRPQAGRENALITPPPPNVIIYGSAQSDSLQNELFNSLEERSISYQLEIGLSSLSSLFINPKPKQIALLLTNIYDEDVIKVELKGKNVPPQSKYLYTYPYRLTSSPVTNLSSVKEVLSVCENLKKAGKRGGSIRLSGVHSINKSYSSSKSITKVSNESHYQSLLYYRNNDYGSIDTPLYQQIIDILSKDNAYHPFLDFSAALKQVQSQPDKKTLVICPSRLAQQISKTLKKKQKQQSTDILLIGPLHPNRFIISKSVVLATESPARVYEYLKTKNMVSPHFISVLFEQLIRNSTVEKQREHEYTGYGPENNEQAHTIVTNFFDKISRPVEVKNEQDIQKAQENRHKIKKIKSPAKSRPSEVPSSFKELDSLHLDNSNKPISIKVSEPQDQPIIQTQEFYTNKQGERLKKKTSEQITSAPNISYPTPAMPHHYPTAHDIRPKMSKFRNPSTIIHQTSDEYRGSNKESIVNDEPQLKYEVERTTRVFRKEQTTQPQEVMVESEQVIEDPQKWAQNGNRQQSNTYNIYNSPVRQQGNNNSQQGSYQWSNRIQSTSPSRPYARIQQETTTTTTNPIAYEQKEGSTRTYGTSGTQEVATRTYGNNHYRPNQQYSSNYSRQLDNHTSGSIQQNGVNGYRVPSSSIPANRANVQIVSPAGVTATTTLSRTATSPVKYNSTNYNLEGYERVEVNGITMYRKKQANNQNNTTMNSPIGQPNASHARYITTSNTYSAQPNRNSYNSNHTNETQNLQYSRDSSPKVLRYEVSPTREAQAITQQFTNREYSRPVPSSPNRYVSNYVSSSTYSPRVDDNTNASRPGGHLKDRAEVKRYQYPQQRLQAGNPSSRTLLNDSNWATRPSELISDGSVLRRNNIRFGVKPRREDVDMSVASSKLTSGIYTIRDLNKKMSLTKKIKGEEELQCQMEHYRHVEIDLTPCHYLIQDELAYIQEKIASIAGAPHKVDRFSCLEDLLQMAQEQLDYGVVLASPEELSKINPNLLPEDYYLLLFSHPSPALELNYQLKTITVDSLERLPLAQKIILDQKLYQYVLFRPGSKDIQAVAGVFNNSEYILEKCEVPFSCEFLDCYYEEMPQLTRVYLICKEKEVKAIVSVVKDYERNNAFFQASSLRIVCVSNENNFKSIYPFLTVLPCLGLTYPEIISLVHSNDKQPALSIHPDKFYLHEQHQVLLQALKKEFPKRFDFYIYQNASELPRKQTKRKRPYSSYLLLHESILGEKVNFQSFSRVFMMGRAKTLPSQVVRVMKKEELMALLKKS